MRCQTFRLLLGMIPLAPVLVMAGACGHEPARIGLVMKAPEGLLQEASGVRLSVFDSSSATCNATTGHVSQIPTDTTSQTFDLENTGCAAGAAWCKDIDLDKDGTTKMFAVVVRKATESTAEGCTTATINQDPLEVDVKVHRIVPPGCCNDGQLQPGEQCDSGKPAPADCSGKPAGACAAIVADEVCACDCKAQEIPLDRRSSDPLPSVGQKKELSMAFSGGKLSLNNALRAAFTDTSSGANGGADVEIRVLDSNLYSIETPPPLQTPLRIPLLCTKVTGAGAVRNQQTASVAAVSAQATAVAYASDEAKGANDFDVFVSAQDPWGCAETPPLELTTGGGTSLPHVAGGPDGTALVVWTRGTEVVGRMIAVGVDANQNLKFDPQGAEIPIAQNATAATVAGSPNGWIVAYQGSGPGDGDGVFKKTVDISGAISSETLVNLVTQDLQDQPTCAALTDGRSIVVWRSKTTNGTDIFFQRYDAAGEPTPSDQDGPLNTELTGDQSNPSVAGGAGFFAVAWEDSAAPDESNIWARFVGGSSGFGYNSVSGQNDAFLASHPAIPYDPATMSVSKSVRHTPAVAIGGSGYVVFGWQDESTLHPGVYVRRFPTPALE